MPQELHLDKYLEQELQEAPSFNEAVEAQIRLQDTRAAREMRRMIISGLLLIFIGVFVACFGLVYLYAFDKLPRLSSEELRWILGTMLIDIIATTVFTWKAATRYLFR